jgi:hypothetical protein
VTARSGSASRGSQPDDKLRALDETRRVLTNTRNHVRHGLSPFVWASGFVDVAETHRETTVFGTLSLYQATKPPAQT